MMELATLYRLAERFNVTVELMNKALLFYSETLSAKYSSACNYL
ncbi:MAG: hypothetical protein RR423_08810 [Hydrogenoanaerobacterium sp.]